MDGVERLAQMNEVERMREIIDVISQSMHKQNDKDRMEMLAMLANTTATETNLMSVNFARRAKLTAIKFVSVALVFASIASISILSLSFCLCML